MNNWLISVGHAGYVPNNTYVLYECSREFALDAFKDELERTADDLDLDMPELTDVSFTGAYALIEGIAHELELLPLEATCEGCTAAHTWRELQPAEFGTCNRCKCDGEVVMPL